MIFISFRVTFSVSKVLKFSEARKAFFQKIVSILALGRSPKISYSSTPSTTLLADLTGHTLVISTLKHFDFTNLIIFFSGYVTLY